MNADLRNSNNWGSILVRLEILQRIRACLVFFNVTTEISSKKCGIYPDPSIRNCDVRDSQPD